MNAETSQSDGYAIIIIIIIIIFCLVNSFSMFFVGYDCGVHLICYTEYICREIVRLISQKNAGSNLQGDIFEQVLEGVTKEDMIKRVSCKRGEVIDIIKRLGKL